MTEKKRQNSLSLDEFSFEKYGTLDTPRPQQLEVIPKIIDALKKKKFFILEAPTGCHLKGTKILMYDGTTKNVEDVIVGDLLMGPDSQPRKVLQLHFGNEMMYKIIPNKGNPFVVNKKHILSLQRTSTRKTSITTKRKDFIEYNPIKNITVENYIQKSKSFKHTYKLYKSSVEFNEKPLKISPYILGLWLGYGNNNDSIVTTNIDTFEDEFLKEELTDNHFKNSLTNDLRYYNLLNNKHIPICYKTNSKENRLELLAGLIDADGYNAGNRYEITSKSLELITDICYVANSLGFGTNLNKKFNKKFNKLYYRLSIFGKDITKIPVRIERKKITNKKPQKDAKRIGFKIEKYGVDNYYGFEVDKDNLYLMDNFIVTHNSGKSMIATTLCNYFSQHDSRTTILVHQKTLQEQYQNEKWKHIKLHNVTSATNYICSEFKDLGLSCSQVSKVKKHKNSCIPECPYLRDRNQFVTAPIGLTNMQFFLNFVLQYKLEHFQREFMVVDECFSHNIMVWVENDRQETIQRIVDNDDINFVMSYNEEKKCYEKKRILRKIKLPCNNDEIWYEIIVRTTKDNVIKKIKKVTGNHKIWTKNRGYVRVDELNNDDILKVDISKKEKKKTNLQSCIVCKKEFKNFRNFFLHYNIKHNKEFANKNVKSRNTEFSKLKKANKCSLTQSGRKKDKYDYLMKHSKRMKIKNPMNNPITVEKVKKSLMEFWKNNPDKLLERKRNFINASKYVKGKKTSYETKIINLQFQEIKYTGDGTFWVSFGKKHKNPDFKIKGQRKVIEVGNSYWHNDLDVNETIENYKKINFECLYLRENELNVPEDELKLKIHKFINNHDAKILQIRKLRKGKTKYKYNLEIEDNNNYFANDILVSNCHSIEDQFLNFISVDINEEVIKNKMKLMIKDKRFGVKSCLKWIDEELKPKVKELEDDYLIKSEELQNKEDEPSRLKFTKYLNEHEYFLKYRQKLDSLISNYDSDTWVFDTEQLEKGGRKFSFKPIMIDKYTNYSLFSRANKFLLMSATILGAERFCENIGIKQDEGVEFLSLPSTFPKDIRPIFYFNSGRMGQDNIHKTLPNMVKDIEKIMDKHKTNKGVIFCHTYRIGDYIKEHMNGKNGERLLFHTSKNRQAILDYHLESEEPTVLLTPSLSEGIDLKDDLSRFQILCKLPFPYLGDERVQKKMKKFEWWYSYKTVKSIVQSLGRSIRSEDDWANSYILDGDWELFYKKNKDMFPVWIKEAMTNDIQKLMFLF
jgi:Rad3-related DNA helicase